MNPFATATELLADLRAGKITSTELTETYIQRIERYDGRLNAVVVRDFERARAQARAADAAGHLTAMGRQDQNGGGALRGLPTTIKESFNVSGLPTTCGVPEWKAFVSQHDSPAWARLRAAGAVLMGKTNVPPMLADWQSANPIYGRTNNPWDLGRTPGGSSGGSAAALAAGLCALEVGSDIGGSIRVPAAFCGVYGHRPSETLLPKSGQFPIPPMPNAAIVMGVQGPLARSAEDLDLALSILAGPEVGEDVAWRVELPAARRERLADFRVGVLPAIPWIALDDQIASTLEDLATRLGTARMHGQARPAGRARRLEGALPALSDAPHDDDERASARGAAPAVSLPGTGSTTTSSHARPRAGSRHRPPSTSSGAASGSSTGRPGAGSSATGTCSWRPRSTRSRIHTSSAPTPRTTAISR